MRFLSLDLVLLIAKRQTEHFGGRFGVRDMALLESAVAAPEFASYYGADVLETAVRYLHVARNHPFLDGNKRTGAAAMLLFLDLNGVALDPIHQEELTERVLDYAEGRIPDDEMVRVLRKMARNIRVKGH